MRNVIDWHEPNLCVYGTRTQFDTDSIVNRNYSSNKWFFPCYKRSIAESSKSGQFMMLRLIEKYFGEIDNFNEQNK